MAEFFPGSMSNVASEVSADVPVERCVATEKPELMPEGDRPIIVTAPLKTRWLPAGVVVVVERIERLGKG